MIKWHLSMDFVIATGSVMPNLSHSEGPAPWWQLEFKCAKYDSINKHLLRDIAILQYIVGGEFELSPQQTIGPGWIVLTMSGEHNPIPAGALQIETLGIGQVPAEIRKCATLAG
jgi:hypothetical protein